MLEILTSSCIIEEMKKQKKVKKAKLQKGQTLVKKLLVFLTIVGVLAAGGYLWYRAKTAPSKYDALAQCLAEKGVKIYGAYWCPNCKEQKKEFGNAWRFINYIECSLPNAAGQKKVCNEAGIERYPTWEFQDGKRFIGKLMPEELGKKANCIL